MVRNVVIRRHQLGVRGHEPEFEGAVEDSGAYEELLGLEDDGED